MRYDVNGWNILAGSFESDAEIENFLEKTIGKHLEADALSSGKYLLDYEELAAIIDGLYLPFDLRVDLLRRIISERSKNKGFPGISGFRQLLCAIFRNKKQPIKCLEIEKLRPLGIDGKKLSDLAANLATDTIKLSVPPQACALKITDKKSADELSLPCGSMIVIDVEHPAAPDELTLLQKSNGTFALGIFSEINSGNTLWHAPVLRLHIIPLETPVA